MQDSFILRNLAFKLCRAMVITFQAEAVKKGAIITQKYAVY